MEYPKLFSEKYAAEADLPALVEGWKRAGMSAVFIAGCFDPIHAGLIRRLKAAREEGDLLVVGVYSDSGVAARLGAPHPLIDAQGRMTILAAVEFVDAVTLIEDGDAARAAALLNPARRVEIVEQPLALK